jgi:hypothetical protein
MTELLAFWAGATLCALAYVLRHNAWGAVAHYRGWEWLIVPLYVVKQLWYFVWHPSEGRDPYRKDRGAGHVRAVSSDS